MTQDRMVNVPYDSIFGIYIRTEGVMRNGNRILLSRAEEDDVWVLPGGSVKLYETTEEALEREILEEMGFFGGVILILFFMIILYEGIKITFSAQHLFLKYMSLSLTLILIIQAFIHIGGVVKFIPLTGVTLPLVSKGGFSFITSLSVIALLMAVSHFNYLKSRN